MNPRFAPLAVALIALMSGCSTAGLAAPAPAAEPARAAVVRQSPAPPPAQLSPVPAPGTVGRASGPFDDRYELTAAALRAGEVTARVQVTSDVSGLIVLEVQADFYDGAGALLGSARSETAEGHGGTSDTELEAEHGGVLVRIAGAPAWRARVASVVLSVPVLVNE